MSGYCDIAPGHALHGPYHDTEYGVPHRGEAVLFERLLLEINQAGLSWETMLRKREGFRAAYGGFDVDTVAAYGEADRARLLGDAGIIRNRLKVDAAIHNAGVIHGGSSAAMRIAAGASESRFKNSVIPANAGIQSLAFRHRADDGADDQDGSRLSPGCRFWSTQKTGGLAYLGSLPVIPANAGIQ